MCRVCRVWLRECHPLGIWGARSSFSCTYKVAQTQPCLVYQSQQLCAPPLHLPDPPAAFSCSPHTPHTPSTPAGSPSWRQARYLGFINTMGHRAHALWLLSSPAGKHAFPSPPASLNPPCQGPELALNISSVWREPYFSQVLLSLSRSSRSPVQRENPQAPRPGPCPAQLRSLSPPCVRFRSISTSACLPDLMEIMH